MQKQQPVQQQQPVRGPRWKRHLMRSALHSALMAALKSQQEAAQWKQWPA